MISMATRMEITWLAYDLHLWEHMICIWSLLHRSGCARHLTFTGPLPWLARQEKPEGSHQAPNESGQRINKSDVLRAIYRHTNGIPDDGLLSCHISHYILHMRMLVTIDTADTSRPPMLNTHLRGTTWHSYTYPSSFSCPINTNGLPWSRQ